MHAEDTQARVFINTGISGGLISNNASTSAITLAFVIANSFYGSGVYQLTMALGSPQ